jgi:single-strand DNA-binding protein
MVIAGWILAAHSTLQTMVLQVSQMGVTKELSPGSYRRQNLQYLRNLGSIMANLNRVLLIGNLTREVDLRYRPKGTPVAEITLAINRVSKSEDGTKREEVTFVDVTLWSRQAELAQQYLRKGNPVFIEGRLQLDSWEHNGQKHSRLRVIAQNLQLLGKRLDPGPSSTTPEESTIAPVPTPSSARPPARVPIEPDLDVEPF